MFICFTNYCHFIDTFCRCCPQSTFSITWKLCLFVWFSPIFLMFFFIFTFSFCFSCFCIFGAFFSVCFVCLFCCCFCIFIFIWFHEMKNLCVFIVENQTFPRLLNADTGKQKTCHCRRLDKPTATPLANPSPTPPNPSDHNSF